MISDFSKVFNFDEAIQHNVDPRTGGYPVIFSLGDIFSHDFYGASFSLKLKHDPLDFDNRGFGQTWSIATLTYYDKQNNKLYTSDGKHYEFDGTKLSKNYGVDAFKIEIDNKNSTVDLVYRSGVRERFSTKEDLNYMTTIFSPEGKKLSFDYFVKKINFRNFYFLSRVSDTFSSRFIFIDYTNPSLVSIRHVLGNTTYLTYQCKINNELLEFVSLPNTTEHGTTISYERIGKTGVFVNELKMPTGYRETVTYTVGDKGHKLPPNNPLRNIVFLPYVSKIIYHNGKNQDDSVRTFTFSRFSNFLGYFGTKEWDDTYGDNIYTAPSSYAYHSTETINGNLKIKKLYNRFHLLVEERHYHMEDKIFNIFLRKIVYTYYCDESKPITEQPSNFMSLKEVNTWFYKKDPTVNIKIDYFYKYDEEGNLLEFSDGRTKYSYEYLSKQEDPLGFIRLLKRTIKAPASGDTPRPIVKDFTYATLPYPKGSGLSGKVPVIATEYCERFKKEFYYQFEDERTFGFLKKSITKKIGFKKNNEITDTETRTVVVKDNKIIEEFTNIGFDNLVTKRSTTRSLFSGLELEASHTSGKTTQYEYDVLNRINLVKHSISDSTFTFQKISYIFDETDNKVRISASDKNVVDVFSYNARGNLISIVRNDFEIEKNFYNSSNLLQTKNIYDYDHLGNQLYAMQYNYTYDALGRQTSVTQNSFGTSEPTLFEEKGYDDVELFSYEKILGMAYKKQFFSIFKDITKTEYYDAKDNLIHTELYEYDAYSRLTKFTSGNLTKTYVYDVYDRTIGIIVTTPETESPTVYLYAEFTTEDLVEELFVDERTIGLRTFDSLGRITSEDLPNFETTTFIYKDAARLPSLVQQGTNRIEYENNDHLDKPLRITYGTGKEYFFTYDKNARLIEAIGNDISIEYKYDNGGFFEKQAIIPFNRNLRSCYFVHSIRGKRTFMIDYLDNELFYKYDNKTGLLSELANENMKITFSYDKINRITSRVFKNLKDNGVTIECKCSYDDRLGRIKRKETSVNNSVVYYEEYSYDKFMMINRIERVLPNADKIIEEVSYDDNGRMITHSYTKGKNVTTSSYSFDNFNNILEYREKLPDGSKKTIEYIPGDNNSPCVINSIEENGKIHTLTYDGGGRVIRDMNGLSYQYDAFGRMDKVSGNFGQTSYYYDPFGTQVLQKMPNDTLCYSYYFEGRLHNCITETDKMTFFSDEQEIFYTTQEFIENTIERYLITDYKGTVVAEISGDKVSQRYEFTAYGDLIENT